MSKTKTFRIPGYGELRFVYIPPVDVPFLSIGDVTRARVAKYTGAPPVGSRVWSLTRGWYVSSTVVSRLLYRLVTSDNIWVSRPGLLFPSNDNAPANMVSHVEAVKFCVALSGILGGRCRLPNELEFEAYSAGGTGFDFFWTKEPWNPEAELSGREYALFNSFDSWKIISKDDALVGSKKPNQYGIYDSIGLIKEWVADEYQHGSGILVAESSGLPQYARDVKFTGGPLRIAKGGTYQGDLGCVGRWVRTASLPTNREDNVGFRVVLDGE